MSQDGSSISSSDPGVAPAGAMPVRRRALLGAGAGLLALGGCGFRPLYGPNGGAEVAEPAIRDQLAATRVALIGERFGQLMRRALTQRLGTGVGGPRQAVYELRIGPGIQAEGLGVQTDGSATRVRYVGTANWLLVRIGPPVEPLFGGTERAVEAYNIPANQFFAADSSREATEQRLAVTLAEQVVTRVAVELRRRATGATPAATGALPDQPEPAPGTAAPPSLGAPGLGGTGPGGTGLGATGLLGVPSAR